MNLLANREAQPKSRLFGFDFVLTIVPAGLLLALVAAYRNAPALSYSNFTTDQVGRTLLSLFLVALVFERALEVIMTTWRGPGATDLENELQEVNDALDFLPRDALLPDAERQARAKKLLESKFAAMKALTKYRCETQRIALHTSFLLGLAVAAAGLRAIEPHVVLPSNPYPLQAGALKALDALLTGGIIAGGSDAIHKIMQAFTDFAESTSARAAGK